MSESRARENLMHGVRYHRVSFLFYSMRYHRKRPISHKPSLLTNRHSDFCKLAVLIRLRRVHPRFRAIDLTYQRD
jgi:hypothetical protein